MTQQNRSRRRPLMAWGWGRACGAMAILLCLAMTAGAQAPPEPTRQAAVLDLLDDGFLTGKLVPVAGEPGRPRTTVLWQSPLFDEPLEFAVDGIERIRFATVGAGAAGADAWRADLRGGDCVAGVLETIDAEHIVLAGNDFGAPPLRIRRGEVVRLTRKESAVKTIVPGGLAGWNADGKVWQEQAGRLVCEKPGSVADRDVGAAARSCFTLALSWDVRPDLELLFASGPNEIARRKDGGGKKEADAEEYRIELTGGDLLVVREGATAKFDIAGTLPAGRGGVKLSVFVDQERGRMAVLMPQGDAGGKIVFDETLAPRKPAVRPGFGIRLRSGDVRVDGLRVSPWKGDAPREFGGTDGPGGSAAITSFDKATGMFTFGGPEDPRQVAATEVEDIEFPTADAEPPAAPPGSVLAGFHGGSRLTGRILDVTGNTLRLECPALVEPLECEFDRLAVLDAVGSRQPAALPGRPGILDATRGRMLGCLANAAGGAGGIAWQPRGAVGPVAIRPTEPLRVGYRGLAALGGVGISLAKKADAWAVERVTPGGPAARDGRIAVGWTLESLRLHANAEPIAVSGLKSDDIRGLLRGVSGSEVWLQFIDVAGMKQQVVLVRDAGGRGDLAGAAERDVLEKTLKFHESRLPRAAQVASGQATVYLKTGDSILCTVLSADAKGLRIRTDLVPDRLVPAIALRAVELLPGGAGSISKDKLARLLTLPRMQQADPPTHVLRLPNGDYLRGKLVSLDERVLRMNVLGVEKEFPRADVARLIWLSVEGDTSESEALAAVTGGGEGRGGVAARATMTDGRRLTLLAQRLDGGRLVGESGVLGTIGIDLAVCDHLVLGPTPAEAAPVELPYGKWKLKPAPAPRALGGGPGAKPAD